MTNLPPMFINSTPPPLDWENSTVDEENDDYDSFELANVGKAVEDDCSFGPSLPDDAWNADVAPNIKKDNYFIHIDTPPPIETFLVKSVEEKEFDFKTLDFKNELSNENEEIEKTKSKGDEIESPLKEESMIVHSNDLENGGSPVHIATSINIDNKNLNFHQDVILEDIIDDTSDNEYCNSNYIIVENTDDFFKVYPVEDQTCSNIIKKIDDTEELSSSKISLSEEPCANPKEVVNAITETFNSLKIESQSVPNIEKNDGIENNRGNSQLLETVPSKPLQKDMEPFDDGFDDFDDFKGFSEAASSSKKFVEIHEDDDDFGDFSSTFQIPFNSFSPSHALTPPSLDVPIDNMQVDQTLQSVFPTVISQSYTDSKTNEKNRLSQLSVLRVEPIETTQALAYQWSNSEIRHALIISLGIDARNILFSDKWNIDVPRFAANLSFDPLIPIKPATPLISTTETNIDSASVSKISDFHPVESNLNNTTELKSCTEVPENDFSAQKTIQNSPFKESYEDQITSVDVCNNDSKAIYSKSQLAETLTSMHPYTPDNSPLPSINSVENKILENRNETFNDFYCQPIIKDSQINSVLQDNEKSFSNDDDEDIAVSDVITTSTFAGPFKETHIYTPSKSEEILSKTAARNNSVKVTKESDCDFDYQIAAAGIVIDETVISKEYRDVEYNPVFITGLNTESQCTNFEETPSTLSSGLESPNFISNLIKEEKPTEADTNECEDDFSDFQYVQPKLEPIVHNASLSSTFGMKNPKIEGESGESKRRGEMILSPAILLPQSISIQTNKPKIEWGETAANINPEELERIEQLYSQSTKRSASHINQSYNPASLSISATIADDEDDWSDFVSVPVMQQHSINNFTKSTTSPKKQLSVTNDEEWSDFISSSTTKQIPTQITASYTPKMHNTTWQGGNYLTETLKITQSKNHHFSYNNNTTTDLDHSRNPSKLNVYTPAKITPNIALIPNLSFIAPKPTQNTFINALPKSNFITKK